MAFLRPLTLLTLLAPFLAVTSVAQIAQPTESDITYLGSDRTEKLDAWLPPASFPRPVPAVLLIHGGGWAIGDKADNRERNIGSNLSAAGYAVFSVNYKLEHKEKSAGGSEHTILAWPQNFYDCKSALRFLRKEAGRFGIDPSRIATMGGSAGGHLALLVGLTAESPEMNAGGLYHEQGNAVACVIDLYGIPDVRRFQRTSFAGATPEESEVNWDRASPIHYLGKGTPPILVLHGTGDQIVPVALSRDFIATLKEKGIPNQYVEIPGAPHTFDLESTGIDLRPVVLAFLQAHLSDSRP